MRVWVLVSWQTDMASDTLGVFASRAAAEAHARADAARDLEWEEEVTREGRVFHLARVGPFDGYAIEEFEVEE